jgi:acetyltransferase-like isoleucine patch superfamily enzyme
LKLLRHLRRNAAGETRLHLADEIRRWRFSVGDYSYGRPRILYAESGAPLTIGRYCSIADRVEIFLGGNHRTSWVTTYPFDNLPRLWPLRPPDERSHVTRGGVTIGNDVWIGSGAVILSGVTVGDGAVIGARASSPATRPASCAGASIPRRSRPSSRPRGGSCRGRVSRR